MTIEETLKTIVEESFRSNFEAFKSDFTVKESFPEVMTLSQVCAYTQYTEPTIRKFIKEKNFPVSAPCGSPRFLKSEVDLWLKNN